MAGSREQGRSLGTSTVFRIVSGLPVSAVVGQLAHRDRWILLLLDGRRTLADVAHLTHRNELEVASTLAHFLVYGYIEQADSVAYSVET